MIRSICPTFSRTRRSSSKIGRGAARDNFRKIGDVSNSHLSPQGRQISTWA